jgi:large subunit ribosomal protein L22
MSRALIKHVRVSPTKARLIAQEVQGMNAELAIASLEFMANKAAGIISKAIASAVANGDFEPQEVEITSCRVDRASYIKRWTPRARGTATRILKPTSHILVEVAPAGSKKETAEVKKAAPKAKKVEAKVEEATVAKKAPAKKAPAKKAEAASEEKPKKAPAKKAAPKAKATKSDEKDA